MADPVRNLASVFSVALISKTTGDAIVNPPLASGDVKIRKGGVSNSWATNLGTLPTSAAGSPMVDGVVTATENDTPQVDIWFHDADGVWYDQIYSYRPRDFAVASFAFDMYDATGALIPSLTSFTAQCSIDGGAYAALATPTVTEVSNGTYKVALTHADLLGKSVTLRFSAPGAVDTHITFLKEL